MPNELPVQLLVEDFASELHFDLNESTTHKGLLTFRGKFQEAESINKNKRRYPFDVLDENVQKLAPIIKSRGLVGELDHPADSIIHFKEASHVITKLWWEDNILMGEGQILNTAYGKILRALLEANVRVGISSRGVGSGKVDENGTLVIGENFKLITFDVVADPSTREAYQQVVTTKNTTENTIIKNNEIFIPKNKNESVYNLSKDTVVAALNGIIKSQTNKYKERLR